MAVPEFSTLATITYASVKTYFGIKTADTSYDVLITAHLQGAVSMVQYICRHDFQSQARANEKPLIDRRSVEFYLKNYPIASMTSLVEDGTTLVENTDYYVDKDTGRVEKITSLDIANPDRDALGYWTTERNVVVVNYVGGEALTDDVISAVKEMAAISAGIKKRTYTDNEGIERVATLNSLPKDIMDILKRHRHRGRIL